MQKKLDYNSAIVIGGSRGLGKSIADRLKKSCNQVFGLSKKDIDTSNLLSVKKFIKKFKKKDIDIIVLNTGGPENIPFNKINEKTWLKYFNQLFLSFCLILKEIKIKKEGYIFYISSSIIKEPSESLIISSSLRVAFSSLLKSLSYSYSKNNISVINIAPGPFKTDRVKDLVKNLKSYEKKLPTGRIGDPEELGKLVHSIIKNKIKYLSGSTVYLDGNISKSFL